MVLYERDIERSASGPFGVAMEELEIAGMAIRLLESCHSLWIVEPSRHRFRRVPRGTRLDMPSPDSDWTPYHRLEIEPSTGAFSVSLNEDDTRVLRSWLHGDPCRHCGTEQTVELSLDELRKRLDRGA